MRSFGKAIGCLGVFLGSSFAVAEPGQSPVSSITTEQIDALFAEFVDASQPGGAVGVAQAGQLIYSRGFGAAHVGYAAPNTARTRFDIASASKSFTTACVAILMDQDKLSPDDDISPNCS